MSFARAEYDENEIRWDTIRARLEEGDGEEDENYGLEVLESNDDDDDEDEEGSSSSSGSRTRARRAARTTPQVASPEVAEKRLPRLKAAAERMRKMKKAAIDPDQGYQRGQRVYDPAVQKFGRVAFAEAGYVRVRFADGTESAHGKPPLEDRRNFVVANFDRMDNKEMAEILGISVHTMRRLCHEYGLKRQGRASA